MTKKTDFKTMLKKTWKFIWDDDSVLSWIVNIVLAFVLIKFIVYPGLGFLLGTNYPIVAVVSSSMEHTAGFEEWWDNNKEWYLDKNITKEDFMKFQSRNGFNKGDIMVLHGKKPKDIQIGEVIVFKSRRPDPIIHRVVDKWEKDGKYYFQTKGDNNPASIRDYYLDETNISGDNVIGKSIIRIPFLGYIKIAFVCGIYGIQGKDNVIQCVVR